MKRNNIMLLVADTGSGFTVACADRYEKTVREAGAEARRFNLSEMDFNPVFCGDYKLQELEPDLLAFQEAVTRADHVVFVYPNWWSTMPAKLKGLFDRVVTPGFAFGFKDGKGGGLLTGKSARVINISSHEDPGELLEKMGSFTNEIEYTLRFCDIDPVSVTCFGPTREDREPSEEQKQQYDRWLREVEDTAREDIT